MNWNNDKLNEIQAIEDSLIYSANCGSSSKLFTTFIHSTSEWIDKENTAKEVHISPYKIQLDKDIDLVAYHIESGYRTDDAFEAAGLNRHSFYSKMTDTHHNILNAARKKRKHNRNY
jgi:hypothetical protein